MLPKNCIRSKTDIGYAWSLDPTDDVRPPIRPPEVDLVIHMASNSGFGQNSESFIVVWQSVFKRKKDK